MKKLLVGLCAVGAILALTSAAWAGGAVNKNNLSAEYIRILNRSAATDYADIVAYNPAGTVKLDEGFTINISAHEVLKTYSNTWGNKDYETTKPSTIPSMYAVYNTGRWAGFFGFNIPLGGGKVEYDQGNRTTAHIAAQLGGLTGPMSTAAESYAKGYTFGGAFQFAEWASLSVAARYVDSMKEQQANVKAAAGTAIVDFNQKAKGWGGVIGLDIFPTEDITIGLTYNSRIQLDYEYSIQPNTNGLGRAVLSGNGVTQGGQVREDMPAQLSTGFSWNLTDDLRTEMSFVYYFNRNADLAGKETRFNNGYDVGIGFEYKVLETLKASAGYLYTSTGVDGADLSDYAPELDANSVGFGVGWEVMPKLDLNFGLGHVWYIDDAATKKIGTTDTVIEYKKDITFIAAGIQYSF